MTSSSLSLRAEGLSGAERVGAAPSELKPGMTADITIKTAAKENVLTVPKSAIEKKDGKIFIQILKDEKAEERQIQIGLEGSDDLVEVISGVQAGEEVILK